MPGKNKAVTLFLLLMAAMLAFYIFAQSSSQVSRGKEAVARKSSALSCAGLVFGVKDIDAKGNSLSITILNEDYSSGRMESVTVSSGSNSRTEKLSIDPGIEKLIALSNFRVVNNFTVHVNDCEDYVKICTPGGCRAKV